MKPVLVPQHLAADGPADLGSCLRREGVPHEVRNSEAGQAFPDDPAPYSALTALGSEMSANDDLPSLRRAERLILQGMDRGLPVIGHCRGGPLMARALGAHVVGSPAPEVGWQPRVVQDGSDAADGFGAWRECTVFQWHGEAFELPPGAQRLAAGACCPNQAFSVGPHLGMRFHLEVDEDKLQRGSFDESARYLEAPGRHASAQTGEAMRTGRVRHLLPHQALAVRVDRRWLAAARR